jgi:uncharacterized membrane protein
MTRKLFHLSLLGLVLVAGAGSYAVRRSLDPAQGNSLECAHRWLSLSGSQCRNIRNEDPGFQQEAQALSQSLEQTRETMKAMLADPDSSSTVIRSQAQAVLDAHHALMRRTVRHLMVMREFADVSQCARLNTLCSNAMQHGSGRGMGMGRGRQGHGMGRGMMNRQRVRGNMNPIVTLTDGQQKALAEINPNNDEEAGQLTQQVIEAHAVFVQTLQDANSPNESISQALEGFIAARTALELSTIDYVLHIRPLLTTDQQQRLIGLCPGGR